MKLIKLLSLFTGIGAFEKSLDRLKIPYELVGFSEIDKYAVKSYCAMHGVDETKNLGDITKIDEKALSKDIDLITYGFPCQDISIAGNQKGLFNEDGSQTRSGLFFDALRIIEETKPKVAIAENVKNLVGKKFNAQFQVVLASLEAVGYNNYWQVLNAKDYGVPQNRERVFIVSIRKDIDNGTFSFPEGFPLELRLKDLLDDEVDEKYYLSDTAIAGFNRHKARNQANGNGFGWNPTDGNVVANTLLEALPTRAGDNFVITNPQLIQVGTLDRPKYHEFSNRVYSPEGIARTLMGSGGNQNDKTGQYLVEPTINKIDIPQTVMVRKYEVDTVKLCELLRAQKDKLDYTILEIVGTLDVPKTKVEHWFRNDEYFTIPDPDIWMKLKVLLEIETDEFDEAIMTFEEKEGAFEKAERHYFADGIAPTLTSASAGNEKFITEVPLKRGYSVEVQEETEDVPPEIDVIGNYSKSEYMATSIVNKNGIAPTVRENHGQVTAVAMRGRKNEDGSYEQNIEVSDREYANSITTAQKDSLIGVQKLFDIPKEVLNDNERQRRVYSVDGASPTLLNRSDSPKIAEGKLRIRKLTPKECFRLMDFDDEDFIKAEAVNSNTQLYKQAGNSIVVAVPVAIIKALIDCGALEEKKENREMELIINELQLPEAIDFNFEEIKQGLTEKVSYYETLVYTDEQIVDAKKDRANLNKLKKAMNDERKRIQEEYMQPLNDFKKKIDELIEIVDKPVKMIDGQVKAYEDKEKQDKLEAIKELFNSMGFQPFVKLEMIMDEKWLNKSESMKKIEEQMQNEMYRIGNEITTLSNLPEFGFEATEVYKTTLDINKAINEAKRMVEVAKARAEHEARIKAQEEEQARLKAEAITQPTNPVAQVIESVERQAETVKQWIKFQALLSEEDALALKEFFNSRNIDFKVAV